MKGFLVTFEGGDGAGKSTQVKNFTNFLRENNFDFICTKEPGGTDVGQEIRSILLHSKGKISSKAEFLLFSASRAQLVEEVVLPALESGKIVVLDRFFDSSFAYQGYAGNLKLQQLEEVTSFATNGLEPNLTFLFDVSYEVGMSRKAKDENLKNLDRMESKGKEYHEKVRSGFLELAKKNKKRIFVVDASKTQDEVFEIVKAEFLKKYKRHS